MKGEPVADEPMVRANDYAPRLSSRLTLPFLRHRVIHKACAAPPSHVGILPPLTAETVSPSTQGVPRPDAFERDMLAQVVHLAIQSGPQLAMGQNIAQRPSRGQEEVPVDDLSGPFLEPRRCGR